MTQLRVVPQRRAVNRRFEVAAADWESVGRAYMPKSEGFAAEQVESPRRQGWDGDGEMGRRHTKDSLNLIPNVVSRPPTRRIRAPR